MSLPTSIITWKWRPTPGYRSTFTSDHVNVLRHMVARNFKAPHRFICITDDPVGLEPGIEYVPLWNDFANVPNPHGNRNPSCYRRLRAFHPDISTVLGDRFVSLDLDIVILADVTPLWDRPEEFVIWGDTAHHTLYNGSMFLLTAGSRPRVWTEFDPRHSPKLTYAAHQFGSDQGWIGLCLGRGEARWGTADGVYSFRNHIVPTGALPPNARVVAFHGRFDPWLPEIRKKYRWVREAYR